MCHFKTQKCSKPVPSFGKGVQNVHTSDVKNTCYEPPSLLPDLSKLNWHCFMGFRKFHLDLCHLLSSKKVSTCFEKFDNFCFVAESLTTHKNKLHVFFYYMQQKLKYSFHRFFLKINRNILTTSLMKILSMILQLNYY